MKILFNRRPVFGPWGGGAKVLASIIEECENRNYQIFFDTDIKSVKDIDILFCMDPRQNEFLSFNDLIDYKQKFGSKIVQRVGDLGTHGKPELLDLVRRSSDYSDCIVFPSKWAKDHANIRNSNQIVVQNAPLKDFIKSTNKYFDKNSIKFVTHHWSDNVMKGFDTYDILNKFCDLNPEYSFTFIGRKPESCLIKNYIEPQNTSELVDTIPKYDIYITASKKEAGANHVLEAIALGLPVLYHEDGGSIVEYCQDYGIGYKNNEELLKLIQDKNILEKIVKDKKTYVRSSEDMARDYIDIFEAI